MKKEIQPYLCTIRIKAKQNRFHNIMIRLMLVFQVVLPQGKDCTGWFFIIGN